MSKVESQMEQAIQDAGFSISDAPPTEAAQPQEASVAPAENAPTTENVQPAEQPVQESVQPSVQENVQESVQEPVQESVQEVQQTEPATESESSLTQENEGGLNDFFESLLSETPTTEPVETTETDSIASDLDPRIQVIADFVQKTGRSPEDWFRYQSLDPSEMDDRTVMRVQMASEYPSLGNDEIELLMNSKYKTDDNVYSEEEVRLSNLQLKIDAQKARESIGSLREEYQTPMASNTAEPVEDPFDQTWLRSNFESLTGLGEIAFDLPGGREFNFGVPQDYRNGLAKENSNMTSFFDKYVDKEGSWDHDLWNMHRTVVDNLPNILQSIYSQGLSDGQRAIVEKAANIDATSPQTNAEQSPDDFVAQQVLDALGRQQTFMK